MNVIINNFDFWNMEAAKYYAPSTSWSAEKKKENAMNKIFSNSWCGSRKRDGIWMMFIKDMEGNLYLRPRAKNTKGEFVNKVDWVPHLHPFFNEMENGTVFLGELYAPWDEQAKTTTSIMNCLLPKALKRQEKEENKLHYYIFDVLAWGGELWMNRPASERFDELVKGWRVYGEGYHEWAYYKYGKELWDDLQLILAEGGEGMVIINEDSVYQPGKRSNGTSLKVKKEIQETIDCVIIGANPPTKLSGTKEPENWEWWFDESANKRITASGCKEAGKDPLYLYKLYVDGGPVVPVTKGWFYGWAGSLKLGLYNGDNLVHIADLSGISDEIKQNWKDMVGTVVEVSCMEIHDTGGLRHPKAINFFRDKPARECTMEQIR